MKRLMLAIMFVMLTASMSFATSQTLKFAWDANASSDHVTGYNIYKSMSATGPWEKLNPELITGITYEAEITDTIEADMYFHCKATDGTNESGASNVVSGRIDNIAPGAPGGMTITIQIKIGMVG